MVVLSQGQSSGAGCKAILSLALFSRMLLMLLVWGLMAMPLFFQSKGDDDKAIVELKPPCLKWV